MPLIMPSQAQKHVTHNEALQRLDALVQLSVISRVIIDPPGGAAEGDTYVVPLGATGDWLGQEDAIAVWQAGGWQIISPGAGWVAYVLDEGQLVRYAGGWQGIAQPESIAFLGINGTADTTNRFVCQSTGVLFNHAGSHTRTTLNKADVSDDASHNYQVGFSSRALVGLLGNDAYTVKVSPDGAGFIEALVADPATGEVAMAQGIKVGGTGPAHVMRDFQSGTWAPTLGPTLTGDLVGATGITVIDAEYVKAGNLVTLSASFDVTGLGTGAFTQKSSLILGNLPFDSATAGQGGVTGMVWGSATAASALGGVVESPNSARVLVLHIGAGEAGVSDRFHVSLSYMSDD
jgi:hypothetical protein